MRKKLRDWRAFNPNKKTLPPTWNKPRNPLRNRVKEPHKPRYSTQWCSSSQGSLASWSVTPVAENTSAALRDREGEEVFWPESSTSPGAERWGLAWGELPSSFSLSRSLDLYVCRSLFLPLDLTFSLSISIIDGLGRVGSGVSPYSSEGSCSSYGGWIGFFFLKKNYYRFLIKK